MIIVWFVEKKSETRRGSVTKHCFDGKTGAQDAKQFILDAIEHPTLDRECENEQIVDVEKGLGVQIDSGGLHPLSLRSVFPNAYADVPVSLGPALIEKTLIEHYLATETGVHPGALAKNIGMPRYLVSEALRNLQKDRRVNSHLNAYGETLYTPSLGALRDEILWLRNLLDEKFAEGVSSGREVGFAEGIAAREGK